jgi:hypothetical protein
VEGLVVFRAVEKPRWVMGLEWPWHVRGTVWVVPEVMTLDSSCLWKAKSAMVGVGEGEEKESVLLLAVVDGGLGWSLFREA